MHWDTYTICEKNRRNRYKNIDFSKRHCIMSLVR